ncbi:lipid IV(A) 3-deoxy-D-manno-octulosonic acid transferase [Methylococcus geothermalis]|uniref:3-deoxy-D-manno-octulosonic acid transferase n=1 Tax=Methylococcus geothermalis TaxID=2681310 RepID=A0A858Q7Q3_9GAMM|nr:lipid IV(A) 3-deoxy-D-manno-octulosonic acid transferase [Methylococcus geothermalis]QJD29736.1 3-deoxy-D-manno-octulosonic acid transferase [Methylococcus geothermalis]
MRSVYTSLFYASLPLVLARLFWRSRANPGYRERVAERFAFYPGPRRPVDVWIHAVSVGEAEAAFSLIATIRRHLPASILVTTTTPTGSARLRKVLGDAVEHVYLPYDLPDGVGRFLDHFSPRLAVIMETEIWPNLFAACRGRGVPLVIANARLSERSARRYGHIRGTLKNLLAGVDIAAQTEDDARRFLAVGADSSAVTVTGNLKFDTELDASTREAGEALKKRVFQERLVWLAASTHPGEERAVLEAFASVRCRHPHLKLVIAPRHPERFEEVARLVATSGYRIARQTQAGEVMPGNFDVFLLDTLGDLMRFYVASDIAFVGGSLVDIGGHNVVEPALAETAIVFGQHTRNFKQICDDLAGGEAALRVHDAEALAAAVDRLAADAGLRAELRRRALAFVERNRGASERHWRLLAPHLRELSTSH